MMAGRYWYGGDAEEAKGNGRRRWRGGKSRWSSVPCSPLAVV